MQPRLFIPGASGFIVNYLSRSDKIAEHLAVTDSLDINTIYLKACRVPDSFRIELYRARMIRGGSVTPDPALHPARHITTISIFMPWTECLAYLPELPKKMSGIQCGII